MKLPRGLFGAAVKKARISKNLTQEKLAELIGITPAHLKQLESGRRNPSFDVLFEIAHLLSLSLDALMCNNYDGATDMRGRINTCLDRCDVHEHEVIYAAVEAMLKKDG